MSFIFLIICALDVLIIFHPPVVNIVKCLSNWTLAGAPLGKLLYAQTAQNLLSLTFMLLEWLTSFLHFLHFIFIPPKNLIYPFDWTDNLHVHNCGYDLHNVLFLVMLRVEYPATHFVFYTLLFACSSISGTRRA